MVVTILLTFTLFIAWYYEDIINCSDYTTSLYTLSDNEDYKIEYPNFNNKDLSDKLIYYLNNGIENIYESNINVMELDLKYSIKYCNKELLSVAFYGYSNVSTSAYPVYRFFTININPKTFSLIKLYDLYNINDEFVEIYIKNFENQINDERVTILDSYTREEIKTMLINADSKFDDIITYYTDNAVGFSMTVAHVIGDHIEIEISKSELDAYLK